MSSTTDQTQRIGYYDLWRGIAIIMVVGIHTLSAHFSQCDFALRQVINCAVPLFLALSGYFAAKQLIDKRLTATSLWCKQIPRIYIPCLVWSGLYIVQTSLKTGNADMIPLIAMALVGGVSVYYFIILIIQLYLLLPLMVRYNNRTTLVATAIVTLAAVATITYLRCIKGIDIPLLYYAGPFTTWILYFMVGVYIAQHKPRYTLILPLVIAAIGYALQCIEGNYLYIHYGEGIGMKLSMILYSMGVILLMFHPQLSGKYRTTPLTRPIEYCGKVSLGIYLTHCFMIGIASRAPYATTVWEVKWIATLLLTLLLVAGSRKLLPQAINRLIGFK